MELAEDVSEALHRQPAPETDHVLALDRIRCEQIPPEGLLDTGILPNQRFDFTQQYTCKNDRRQAGKPMIQEARKHTERLAEITG